MSSTNALPVGSLVGGLEIRRVLGSGGFGIVYEAFDGALSRSVALKEYFLQGYVHRVGLNVVPADEDTVDIVHQGKDRFLREARLLANLHENAHIASSSLVIVHAVIEANQTAYMAMKMYRGLTLKKYVQANRTSITEEWVVRMMSSVLDALHALHSLPGEALVHRDVSPDNIIIQPDDTPVLLDFGAARNTEVELSAMIYRPGYSPVEQYSEAFHQGPWTDLFALCATAYFAISGRPPGKATEHLLRETLVDATPETANRYSDEFLALLERGLKLDPRERFQSVAAMRRALASLSMASGIEATLTARDEPDNDSTIFSVPNRGQTTVSGSSDSGVQSAMWSESQDTVLMPESPSSTAPPQVLKDRPVEDRLSTLKSAARPSIAPIAALSFVGVAGIVAFALWWNGRSTPDVKISSPPAPIRATQMESSPIAIDPGNSAGLTSRVSGLQCAVKDVSWACLVEGLSRLGSTSGATTFTVEPRNVPVGERLNLGVNSKAGGYLYIFTVDDVRDARLSLLFPRADDGNNRLGASVLMQLPRRPSWDIVMQPPVGRSWLIAVVTSKPVLAWSPATFKPIGAANLIKGFAAEEPWRALGLDLCSGGKGCPEPLTVSAVDLNVR